jgi:hypothetical protein
MKRMRGNAVGLGTAIGCIALVLGCSPNSSPVPGGGGFDPETGGQTGDPGVKSMEHVSGAWQEESGSGSCGGPLVTDVPRDAALRWPEHGSEPVLVVEMTPDAPGTLLVADLAFGLRVIDARDPDALTAGAALALDSAPLQVHRVDEARVLVVTAREVLFVSLAGDTPSVLARAEHAGDPRSSHLLAGGEAPSLHVLLDHRDDGASICWQRERTSIARHALRGDRLEPMSEVDLGAAVQAVRFEGEHALVVSAEHFSDDAKSRPSGLQWVALAPEEPRIGRRTELGGVVGPAEDVFVAGTVLEALVQHVDGGRAEWVRFDAADRFDMVRLPGCELPIGASHPGSFSSHRSLFASEALVVRDGRAGEEIERGTGRVVRTGDQGCVVTELELPADSVLLLGPSGTLLALGGAEHDPSAGAGQEDALEAVLFDLGAELATPVATVTVPIDRSDERVTRFSPGDAVLLDGAVRLGDAAAPETALLLVPTMFTDRNGYLETSSMISVGTGSLTARGELRAAFAPLQAGDRLYMAGHDRLSAFALDGADLPAPLASSVLWPLVRSAWLVNDAIAQERQREGDPWSEAPATPVEFVTREDQEPREVLGEVAVGGEAQLFRVGDRVVSIELDHWASQAPPTLRVLDFEDPAAPREVGRLEHEALGGGFERASIPGDVRSGATEDTLILRPASYARPFGRSAMFDFLVIDLQDPTAPRSHEVTVIEGHSVFLGDAVYHTHAVALEGTSRDRPEVRHFLQRIDVSDPSAPAVSDAINVPGEVIAVDGEALYLRDAQWDGDELRHFVRRVEIDDSGARITQSRPVGMRPSSAFLTAAGDLAVTLFTPPCTYCSAGDSRLLLLSAQELEELGEIELQGLCWLAGQVDDTLVVASWHNVQLVDVESAESPELALLIPSAKLVDLRGGELLYIRGLAYGAPGGLFRLDLSAPPR